MMPEIDAATLDAMERYGGSFVVALARLYHRADPENRVILQDAFGKIFTEYAGIARMRRDK